MEMERYLEEQMDEEVAAPVIQMETQLKRYHKVEEQVDKEAAKKRKIELDAQERKRLAQAELYAKFDRMMKEGFDEEEITDFYAFQAKGFRKFWDGLYHNPKGSFGTFEDETSICAMRFTDEPAPSGGYLGTTLQIFSVKLAGLRGNMQLPLDVYGMVAIRDPLDHNRNIIFRRKRDNCQTLTKEDLSLVLTGPIRAVMLWDTVIFEVELKVRNAIESEDKVLSFLAAGIKSINAFPPYSCELKKYFPSKLSTLEFTLGHMFYSVEATISVKVTEGSWRDDSHGQFSASTASIRDAEVVLLDFGDEKLRLDGNNIFLSRSVVSVEFRGELKISVKTRQSDKAVKDKAVEDHVVFTPLKMGRSHGELNVGFCKMEVTVAWSLFA